MYDQRFDKKQLILVAILVGGILFGIGYRNGQIQQKNVDQTVMVNEQSTEKLNSDSGDKNDSTAQQKAPKKIKIYICGAVQKPGVYELSEGSRIVDGIQLAIPQKNADLDGVNLAAVLEDGEQVQILTKGVDNPSQQGSSKGTGSSGSVSLRGSSSQKINLNQATVEALDSLPGIGMATAQKIIDYRKSHGKFKKIEELTEVPGIGEKKFNDLKSYIRV